MAAHKVLVELVAKGDQAANEFKKTAQAADRLTGAQKGQQSSVQALTGFLRNNAGALAVVGTTAGVVAGAVASSINAFTSYASEVRTFQRITGSSADTASKFTYALDKLGIGVDKGAGAIFMMAKKIGSGKAELDKFGISIARSAGGAVDLTGTLLNVADAYNKTNDPAKRAAIAAAAFGKQGKELIPILQRGRDGLKQLFDEAKNTNHLLSQEDLDRAKEFGLATKELSNTFQGLQIKVGAALTPIVTDLANIASGMVQLADKAHIFDVWGQEVRAFLGPLEMAATEIRGLGQAFGLLDNSMSQSTLVQKGLADAQKRYSDLVAEGKGKSKEAAYELDQISQFSKLAGVAQDGLAGAMKTAKQQAADEATALRGLTQDLLGLGDASRGVQSAQLQYADAQAQVADAVDALNAAKAKGRQEGETDEQYTRRIAGLERQVQEALLGVANAHDNVAAASLKALTSQQQFDAAAKDPTARAKLIQQLEDARNKFGDATGAIGEAITKLQAYDNTNPKDKHLKVDNSEAKARVDEVAAWLAGIHDKSVYIHVRGDTVWSNGNGGGIVTKGPDIGQTFGGGRASGGPVMPNSTYLVGERGPELLRLGGQGGSITPNGALGGSTVNVTVNAQMLEPTPESAKKLARLLNQYVGTHGAGGLRRN